MEKRWSPKGRIQAGRPSHCDEPGTAREHTNATKRVANLSLAAPWSEALLNAPGRARNAQHCVRSGTEEVPHRLVRTGLHPHDISSDDRSHASRTPRRTTGGLLVAHFPERTTAMPQHETSATSETQLQAVAAADPLLTPDDVSTMLGGVPTATLKRWRTQRTGPVALHIGRHVRYRRSAVEAWLATKDREAADWMAS